MQNAHAVGAKRWEEKKLIIEYDCGTLHQPHFASCVPTVFGAFDLFFQDGADWKDRSGFNIFLNPRPAGGGGGEGTVRL